LHPYGDSVRRFLGHMLRLLHQYGFGKINKRFSALGVFPFVFVDFLEDEFAFDGISPKALKVSRSLRNCILETCSRKSGRWI